LVTKFPTTLRRAMAVIVYDESAECVTDFRYGLELLALID
jgi:hypothetical protein